MKFELTNELLCYRRDEIRNVMASIETATSVLQEARLKTKDPEVIQKIDFALNRLVCEVPDKLSVKNEN